MYVKSFAKTTAAEIYYCNIQLPFSGRPGGKCLLIFFSVVGSIFAPIFMMKNSRRTDRQLLPPTTRNRLKTIESSCKHGGGTVGLFAWLTGFFKRNFGFCVCSVCVRVVLVHNMQETHQIFSRSGDSRCVNFSTNLQLNVKICGNRLWHCNYCTRLNTGSVHLQALVGSVNTHY